MYFSGPLDNPGRIDRFPFRGEGIECYYMMIRRKLKTLNDLKRKVMDELNLNPAWYDIKIIYRYPQKKKNRNFLGLNISPKKKSLCIHHMINKHAPIMTHNHKNATIDVINTHAQGSTSPINTDKKI